MTSIIKKDLLIMDVPYSDFTWNSGWKQFVSTAVTIPTGRTVVGLLVTPTNVTAVMSGRINGLHQIQVAGIYTGDATSIDGTATFTCKILLQ